MHTLTFDINLLVRLAQHAVESKEHTFGYDVLFMKEYHKGGKIKKKDGWPDKENIDHAKLTPALMLVKDQGVYFMSNGVPALPVGENVVYAKEADPTAMPPDEWYPNAREIMGGDDTVMTLFDWPQTVLKAQAEGAEAIRVLVTPEAVEIAPVYAKRRPRRRG